MGLEHEEREGVRAMSMQASRERHSEQMSGTFEAERSHTGTELPVSDAIAEAHRLACEIERLLIHRADDGEAYGMRLARALAQSLIDQLAELARDRKGTKVA